MAFFHKIVLKNGNKKQLKKRKKNFEKKTESQKDGADESERIADVISVERMQEKEKNGDREVEK